VLLQRLTDRLDGGVPLARATFRTVGHSYPRNRDRAAFGAAALPALVARAVRHGWVDIDVLEPSTSAAPLRRDPTDGQMVRHLVAHTGRVIRHHLRSIVVGARWSVAVRCLDAPGHGDVDVVADGATDVRAGAGDACSWAWLPERRSGYHADPFPARRDGVTAVMVEDFDERTGSGVISALVDDGSGRWQARRGVLDPGGHASYPFLVDDGDELYCIPETARLGRTEAWRCRRFPDHWERAFTLIDEPVVDPTPTRWQGRWWLFGGRGDRDANTELWLWSADELAGPWTPHPLNPVKIDVTSSRPAGTPFVRDGRLIRPAQDCSHTYGGAVVLNEVLAIDDTRFVERVVERLDPPAGRYRAGMHTRSQRDGLLTVDAKRAVFDPHRSWRELRARAHRRPETSRP
ncbi:MAG: hypothetical protein ACK5OX_00595, partial [Desertimonas sp.]